MNVIIQGNIQLAMIVYSYSEHENEDNTAESLDSSSDEELEECVVQNIEVLLNTLSDRTDSENAETPIHVPSAESESFGSPSKCCFVCSVHKLLELVGTTCHTKGCDKTCHITYTYCGVCMVMKGMCGDGHGFTWTSSDTLTNKAGSNLFKDNLDIASAVVLSGNNYAKMALFFRFLNIHIVSKTTFHLYQRNYICKGINNFYLTEHVSFMQCICCATSTLYFYKRKNYWRSIRARELYWLETGDVIRQDPVQNSVHILSWTLNLTKFCT